ncbi:hypothetical protein D3C86_1852840 [compost metagenome]
MQMHLTESQAGVGDSVDSEDGLDVTDVAANGGCNLVLLSRTFRLATEAGRGPCRSEFRRRDFAQCIGGIHHEHRA